MADVTTISPEAIERKRALAAMMRVAAEPIEREPEAGRLREFAEMGLFNEVPEGLGNPDLHEGFATLAAWLADAGDADIAELGSEWLRLFGGVGEPQAPCWANYYFDRVEHRALGGETIRVRDAYRTFGLQIERLNKEPDDSLWHMMRFLAHLMEAECDAREAEDAAEAARYADGQQAFLREHLLPWAQAWRDAALAHASSGFYRGWTQFTFGLVRECAQSNGFTYDEADGTFALGASATAMAAQGAA